MAAPKTKVQKQPPKNFLEALRELGDDFRQEAKIQVSQIVTQDVPESLGLYSSPSRGTLAPNESLSLSPDRAYRPEYSQAEAGPDAAMLARLRQLNEEDARLRHRETTQIREQIKVIQEEVRLLAAQAGQFSQEIEIATMQATVSPGVYHKNFFAHLKAIIVTLRKKVSASRSWLAEHNTRAGKRGHFWGQVSKSGTSYMLSSERYAVMSTG